MIFLGRVDLRGGVHNRARKRVRIPAGEWIVQQSGVWTTIHRVRFVSTEKRAVVAVAALLHNHVNDAAKGTAVLGFDARRLDLHFLNELEGNVGVGCATGDVFRILTIDEVSTFRISGPSNGETDSQAIAGSARQG